MRRDLAARFESFVSPEPNTGCWLWLGAISDAGYGILTIAGRNVRASHVALALDGRPLGRGERGLHVCDFPPCVNPAHLFGGTQADNMRDCSRKGRIHRGPRPSVRGERHWTRRYPDLAAQSAPKGEAVGTARLTAAQVSEIRMRSAAGEEGKALAAAYGVSRAAVSLLLNGKTWRSVP